MMTLTDFLKLHGYEKIEHAFNWGEYIAHSVDLGSGCIGLPLFVLEKDNNFRLSDPEESLKIFHRECELFYQNDEE